MKPKVTFLTVALVGSVWGLFLGSCASSAQPVSEAEYAAKIVGSWQGTVGRLRETISIHGDHTFDCELQETGFIANTLSQGGTGRIHGSWKMAGAIVTLSISSAENERLRNRIASGTIMSFKGDEVVLKSSRGEISSFRRVHPL